MWLETAQPAALRGQPVVADYHATWCGPCKMLAPAVEELAGKAWPWVLVAKVDVDKCPTTASQAGVSGVPQITTYFQGQVLDSMSGADPAKLALQVEGAVAKAMASRSAGKPAGWPPNEHGFAVQTVLATGVLQAVVPDCVAWLQA
jgi:thioredoxin 1